MCGDRARARQYMDATCRYASPSGARIALQAIAPGDALRAEADALADRLAAGPTRSYAGTQRQLNAWMYSRMHEQLELEASIQHELAASGDFMEGVAAFVEKRPAAFQGR